MAGWLARQNLKFIADLMSKAILFLAPGAVAFAGGLVLPNCFPVPSSLTFPAVGVLHDPQEAIQPPSRVQSQEKIQPPPEPSWTTRAKVLRVIDGDTVEVEVRRVVRVRMLDCWSPESKMDSRLPAEQQADEKKAGIASRENLRRLCEGRDVIVQIPAHVEVAKAITLNRWLARVWVEGDGESLSEKQVKGGFATKVKREELK
jgi:endonuclease YncB( thermonuclease family)